MPHTCHAMGCNKPVKPELLMCLEHWRMVSRPTQLRVWAAYRPGQCDDKRPSLEWCRAADRAVEEVARRENMTVDRGLGFVAAFHPEASR